MAQGLRPMRLRATDDEQSPSAPEALLISAMLEQGSFDPSAYFIGENDVEAWRKLWDFGVEYQSKAGVAPPLSLVRRQFPEFELTPDIDVSWAASKVREAAAARDLRTRSMRMLAALSEEDLDGAFGAFEGMQRPRGHRKEPTSVFDHGLISDTFDGAKIEVPYPTLARATHGGIGRSQLWYLAARLGQGKTWELLGYAARAAKTGYRVGIASLEMPDAQMAARSLKRLAGRDAKLVAMLEDEEERVRKEAVDIIAASTPGAIEVADPSHGQINTTTAIAEMCREYDLVMVDHAGLLVGPDGRRAIDDWRSMAVISNVLREITLSTSTPVLAAAQINREGEKSHSQAPPKASNLSQSDALGQDADVVITMKRLSERVMVHSAEKVRNGPTLRWYTRFDPARARFEEISKEAAAELGMLDEDREQK